MDYVAIILPYHYLKVTALPGLGGITFQCPFWVAQIHISPLPGHCPVHSVAELSDPERSRQVANNGIICQVTDVGLGTCRAVLDSVFLVLETSFMEKLGFSEIYKLCVLPYGVIA